MNLNKDPESWAKVKPDAFLAGNIAQAKNVIEMAVQDIARLAEEVQRLRRITDAAKDFADYHSEYEVDDLRDIFTGKLKDYALDDKQALLILLCREERA